jgi:hypothetical protein
VLFFSTTGDEGVLRAPRQTKWEKCDVLLWTLVGFFLAILRSDHHKSLRLFSLARRHSY